MRKRQAAIRLIAFGIILLAMLASLAFTYLRGELSAQPADQRGLLDWLRMLFD